MDSRGWARALSPAEAGLLLTIGTLPAPLSEAADLLWSQMPQPRHRQAIDETGVGGQLDAAVAALSTPSAYEHHVVGPAAQLSQGSEASHRSDGGHHGGMHDHEENEEDADPAHELNHDHQNPVQHTGHDMGGHGMDHDGHATDEHDGHDAGGHEMDHSDHEMGGHGGHDMGGHAHMHHGGEVAGLAMAGTAPDRDGLQLDELKVALGPVLAGWPTGLVLKASMQGDVLTNVSLSWICGVEDDHHLRQDSRHRSTLLLVDALAQFALVAGWPHAARQARHARAALSSDDPDERRRGRRRARAVAQTIRRSPLLAWSVGGLGDDRGHAEEPDTRQACRTGDVLERVRALCTVVIGDDPSMETVPGVGPEDVEFLLEGAELAAARLIVASFMFETAPTVVHSGAGHA